VMGSSSYSSSSSSSIWALQLDTRCQKQHVDPRDGWDPPSPSLRRDRLYGTYGTNGLARGFREPQTANGKPLTPSTILLYEQA
jgi:hypothetical protein